MVSAMENDNYEIVGLNYIFELYREISLRKVLNNKNSVWNLKKKYDKCEIYKGVNSISPVNRMVHQVYFILIHPLLLFLLRK